jgi:adenine-specific DNA methylase
MPRVRSRVKSLHKNNTDNKALSWQDLTNSAEMELNRLEDRRAKLTQAIVVFKKRLEEGAPCIGAEAQVR